MRKALFALAARFIHANVLGGGYCKTTLFEEAAARRLVLVCFVLGSSQALRLVALVELHRVLLFASFGRSYAKLAFTKEVASGARRLDISNGH